MTSLREFHKQRAKVLVPKSASLRPYRRMLGVERTPLDRVFRGIVPRPTRAIMARRAAAQGARHTNVMDPFRFPEPKRNGRAARMRRRAAHERVGIARMVREVLTVHELVHRSRGGVGPYPPVDWGQLPVAGR